MFRYFAAAMGKYATFSGRARRKEFWFFILASMIITAVVEGIYGENGSMAKLLSMLLFVPTLAVACRRLHDTGRSGWWLLLAPTGIGTIILFFMMAKAGDYQDNEYGPNPKLNNPHDNGGRCGKRGWHQRSRRKNDDDLYV